jgi:hypothetical protein
MPQDPPKAREDYIDTDDLFSKLDQLINRHQGRVPAQPAAAPVPTLTEAVEAPVSPEPQIPVLNDIVDIGEAARGAARAIPGLSEAARRQLQIALYLRLRQRLDQELSGEAFAFVPPNQLSRVTQALRSALSEAVRASVEQLFADMSGR